MSRYLTPHRYTRFCLVPDSLMCRQELSPIAKDVWGRLMYHAYNESYAQVSAAELANEIGSSPRTVERAIVDLREHGLIESKRVGLGQPNKYWLLDHEWLEETPPTGTPTGSRTETASETDPLQPAEYNRPDGGSGTVVETDPSFTSRSTSEVKSSQTPSANAKRTRRKPRQQFQGTVGEEYGSALDEAPRRRRRTEVQTDNVTQLHRPNSGIGLATEFQTKLAKVWPVAAAAFAPQPLASHITRWIRGGWDPVVIRRAMDVYLARPPAKLKTAKDPGWQFVNERVALYEAAAKRHDAETRTDWGEGDYGSRTLSDDEVARWRVN